MLHWLEAAMVAAALWLCAWMPSVSIAAPAPAVSSYCFDREIDDGRPRSACIQLQSYTRDVCSVIARDAEAAHLPIAYFARLIWQESHFDANAISRAGAEGIAQFMPETGRLQRLANPYNPAEALWRSANYLDTLRQRFGNLGLAAIAYNGGENRAARFIAGTGYLAVETLDYVEIVTGIAATDWLAGEAPASDFALQPDKPFQDACVELAEANRLTEFTPPDAIVQPWGIQLAEFFSRANARAAFDRLRQRYAGVLSGEELMLVARRNPNFGGALRYRVEIGRPGRAEATTLCTLYRKAGGVCLVVSN